MGLGGDNLLVSNSRGSIILLNFIRKDKITNAINNCCQVKPLFQIFLNPALRTEYARVGLTGTRVVIEIKSLVITPVWKSTQ